MTLDPFLTAAPHIQLHAATALLAILLGPFALYRRQRDRTHKITGYIWVLAMATAAFSSFFIHSFPLVGPFSPIHLLAVLALWSLWRAISFVRAGRVALHAQVLRSLYWRGLMIAGLFNFLPGRTTNRSLLGGDDTAGYVIIALGLTAIFAPMLWKMAQNTTAKIST